MTPANTFDDRSGAYAAARPLYPQALFDWIAATCRDQESAWRTMLSVVVRPSCSTSG